MSRKAVLVLTMVVGWVLLMAPAASAHAELVATTPSTGQHLAGPPTVVTLRFTEAVAPVTDAIQLLNSDGRAVNRAKASRVAGHPDQVSLPVPTDLPDGAYLVTWRVVSADSHPVHGSFAFSVGQASGAAAVAAGRTGQSDLSEAPFWLFRGLGYAALAVLLGGAVFLLACWPAGRTDSWALRLIGLGWTAALVSSVAVLLMEGPYATGSSWGHLFDPALLRQTADSGFGRSVLARMALLALAAAVYLRVRTVGLDRAGTWTRGVAVLVGLGLPVAWAAGGHASTDGVVQFAADAVHVTAMAAWLGGLALLFGCVLLPRRTTSVADVADVLPRFSRLATICVAALVLTGTVRAWHELSGAAWSSDDGYLRVLVFKVAAFVLLLSVGAASRALVRYRSARIALAEETAEVIPARTVSARTVAARAVPAQTASGGGVTTQTVVAARTVPARRVSARAARKQRQAQQERDRAALSLLRRSAGTELAIALGVLGLTATLVATPPPQHHHEDAAAATTASGPFLRAIPLPGGGDVQVWLDPARAGRNQLIVNVRNAGGLNRNVPEVRAQLSQAALGGAPMTVPLVRTQPGRFTDTTLELPAAGTWMLTVTVRTSDTDESTVSTPVPVGS